MPAAARADLKFFERAAVDLCGASAVGGALRERGLLLGVHYADKLALRVPAVLGDACEVLTTPLGHDAAGRLVVRSSLARQSEFLEDWDWTSTATDKQATIT